MANNYWKTISVSRLKPGDLMQFENGKLLYEIFSVTPQPDGWCSVVYGHRETRREFRQFFNPVSKVVIHNKKYVYD